MTRTAAMQRWRRSSSQRPVLKFPRGGLGPRQLTVLGLGGFDSLAALFAGDVETATGLQRPNVHKMLQRLTELGHLVQVPDERPARWRRPHPSDS
jgi:hypothetical protein